MFAKSFPLFFISCIVFAACNNGTSTSENRMDRSAKKDTLNYPFTPTYSINWRPGDEKNALLVLNCLKKYVDGDIHGCVAAFADTAEFIADQFQFKGSRDSLEKIIAAMRDASVSVSKNFQSWATMYYPDKDATWVTLWYIEKMTDQTGNTDSIYYTDDVMVKNNQIVVYDEKQRRFAEK